MACGARVDGPPFGLPLIRNFATRRVALETARVGVGTGGNRIPHATGGRSVTSRAIRLRRVYGVAEAGCERRDRGERLHLSGIDIRVADAAERLVLLLEVLCVAARAGNMAGKLYLRRTNFGGVADEAR